MTLEKRQEEFWERFHRIVCEWNPCMDDDGQLRYRWGAGVGAHDVEVDSATVDGNAGAQGVAMADDAVSQAGDRKRMWNVSVGFLPRRFRRTADRALEQLAAAGAGDA